MVLVISCIFLTHVIETDSGDSSIRVQHVLVMMLTRTVKHLVTFSSISYRRDSWLLLAPDRDLIISIFRQVFY